MSLAAFLALAAPFLLAQDFSVDGNRWYEIEISIFTNEHPRNTNSELSIPEKNELGYPENLRRLTPATASLSVPFDTLPGTDEYGANESVLPDAGPETRSVPGSFRVADFQRDPFIALGPGEAEFRRYNEDIVSSPAHRLLYHAVWRQPLLNRVQSSALFVTGGELYGNHRELEGSLMFSYNVNRVDLETNLWLMRFAPATFSSRDGNRWKVPQAPFPVNPPGPPNSPAPSDSRGSNTPAASRNLYQVTDVSLMRETRPMTSNVLHYLDHPELGILVEIRPYQLPPLSRFNLD